MASKSLTLNFAVDENTKDTVFGKIPDLESTNELFNLMWDYALQRVTHSLMYHYNVKAELKQWSDGTNKSVKITAPVEYWLEMQKCLPTFTQASKLYFDKHQSIYWVDGKQINIIKKDPMF